MSSTPTPENDVKATADMDDSCEEFEFSSDIGQLMGLIINTFYSDKDVFLRELISNAADAVHKIHLASLTDGSVLGSNTDLYIDIAPDAEAGTLTIYDTGVGMTHDHLVENLGTIARSGTKQFMEAAASGQLSTADSNNGSSSSSLIGQFGVGFYSSFLVASHVDVYSKHNDDEHTWKWSSNASGSFTVSLVRETRDLLVRGTRIVLHLKPDQRGLLEEKRIRDLVQKHSQFITTPIRLLTTRVEKRAAATTDGDDGDVGKADDEDGDGAAIIEDVSEEEENQQQQKGGDGEQQKEEEEEEEEVTIREFERLNVQQPIWTRKASDVSRDEYDAFYMKTTHDWKPPLTVTHISVEGQFQFKALLFCPGRMASQDSDFMTHREKNIKVYARRVFVTDECSEKLMPDYLGFMTGVVDSEDLPLNVSRETLQTSKALPVIRKHLVKKALETFAKLANDANDQETWYNFYGSHGKFLKMGVHEDAANRSKLVELLRFTSSLTGGATSFAEYVGRIAAKEEELGSNEQKGEEEIKNQRSIYFIAGESERVVGASPCVEALRKRGVEVLYLTDTMDEYVMQKVKVYHAANDVDYKLVDVSKSGVNLDFLSSADELAQQGAERTVWAPVCAFVQSVLGERAEQVVLSERLDTSPCVIVTSQDGWSANMERIMKTQASGGGSGEMMAQHMRGKKTLELNPQHSVVQKLRHYIVGAEKEENSGGGNDNNLDANSSNSGSSFEVKMRARQAADNRKSARFLADTLFQTALLTSGFAPDNPTEYGARIFDMLDRGCDGDVFSTYLGDEWNDGNDDDEPGREGSGDSVEEKEEKGCCPSSDDTATLEVGGGECEEKELAGDDGASIQTEEEVMY